jgi:hypothetical protein
MLIILFISKVIKALAKNGSFGFVEGRLVCQAKPNVPFVILAKIEFKKMCGGENKKYRKVGNECRLNCCPVAMWSVCRWSPVKISVSFYV